MSWAAFFIGFFSGMLVEFLGKIMYDFIKNYAGTALLRCIKIKALDEYKRVGNEGFWIVKLIIGKGNCFTNVIRDKATVEIRPFVKFEGSGLKSRALAFKVDPIVVDISEKTSAFNIIRNSEVTLAVAKRSFEDMNLYQFGGNFSEIPLDKTYSMTIVIRDKRNRIISEHTIKDYIRDGNVVVDEANNYEL